MGRTPTVAGDVYSFGITLLELFTGKSPTDEGFSEKQNIVKWVQSTYLRDLIEFQTVGSPSSQLSQLIGFHCSHYEGREISEQNQMDCLIQVIAIAISCVANSSNKRITIKDALLRLQNARNSLHRLS